MGEFKYGLINCNNHSKKVCFIVLTLAVFMVIVQILPKNIIKVAKMREILNRRQKILNDTKRETKDEFNGMIERRENGRWYNFSTVHFRMYAYSAFYDDRVSLLSEPVIRITVVSDSYEDFEKRNTSKEYYLCCILHYDTEDIAMRMKERPKPTGYGWGLNKKHAREYLYTCPTIKDTVPTSVSLTTGQNWNSTAGVPVVVPKRPESKREFCVCVQAVYGSMLNPYRIIEWLELQKILGVSAVGIYVLSSPESVLKVFRHYSDENFVDLRKMEYIYSNETGASEFWLHLTPAINDCIYRHMHEFSRVVVIDFDEFIMPRKHQNLSELVRYLDQMYLLKKSPHTNYDFRNNYFFTDLPSDESISEHLTTLRFRNRVKVSGRGYSVKSILNPQSCVHMHNHFCWGVTPNYTSYGNSEAVDPEIGLNQHYKRCHLSQKECQDMMNVTIKDDIMLRFKKILTRNVNEKIKQIMGRHIR